MKIFKRLFTKDATREDYDKILDAQERDIIELEELNVQQMRRIKDLEKQIGFYQEQLKIVEGIKIDEKSKVNLWKVLAAVGATIGAVLGSWFTKDKD